MENITLEQVEEEEKKHSKKGFFLGILYLAVGTVSSLAMLKGMEYFQIKTFSTNDSFITTIYSDFLFRTVILFLSFFIIPSVFDFIFRTRSKWTVKQYLTTILPFVVPCIPVIWLSFFSYVDIGAKSITHNPFLPGEKKVYIWEDIQSVVIDESSYRSKRFDYYVNFQDGSNLDIWGDTGMKIEELKQVDDMIRKRGVLKYINEPPNEKEIIDAYADHPEKYKMVQQIITE